MLSSEGDYNAAVVGGKGSIVVGGKTFLIDPISDQITGTLHNYFRRTMKSPLASIAEVLKDARRLTKVCNCGSGQNAS